MANAGVGMGQEVVSLGGAPRHIGTDVRPARQWRPEPAPGTSHIAHEGGAAQCPRLDAAPRPNKVSRVPNFCANI